jgi:integrase
VVLRLVYWHGLRASEAVQMRWSQVDLYIGVLRVARVKGSKDSTHSLDRDDCGICANSDKQVTGLYLFETERGGPLSVDALQYIVREAGRLAKLDWRCTRTCSAMRQATARQIRVWIPG